jgi:hypothetical protein
LSTSGLAVLIVIGIGAIQWIDVQNFRADGQKFIACFYGMASPNERVIELGVEGRWILELGISRLSAECRVAESGNYLRGKTAG